MQSSKEIPAALEAAGRRLSLRCRGLVETSIARCIGGDEAAQALMNVSDSAWETGGDEMSRRMMEGRHATLALMERDMDGLSRSLGWAAGVRSAAADLLLPLLDLSERSCYTFYGHQHRTMEYASIIVEKRGIEDPDRSLFLLGAMMHDIGKLSVPAGMLRSVERPRPEERAFIDLHPLYGRDILRAAFAQLADGDSVLLEHGRAIADIAFSHQEKFGGTGYPKGAAGEGISLGARIAAFCDSFDTMTSVRAYNRSPKTFAEAKAEAMRVLNDHFNERIVADFLEAAGHPAVLERIYGIIRGAGGKPE